MANPTIPRQAKTAKLDAMLDDKTFTQISKNLILTLSANGRIGDTQKVVDSFVEIMEASRGAVKVVITAAAELPKATLATVEKAAMGLVEKGQKVTIEVKTNPEILGGLQVLVGDKFLDLSVSSRVQALSAELESAEL